MSSNGFTRGGRSGRTPHFLTVGLLVVICILAFNYWNISSRNKVLDALNSKMKDNIEELVLRKVHLEKRTDALNKELQGNNQVVHETQDKANSCQENLKAVGEERDLLRAKVSEDEEQIKQLQRSMDDFNDSMDQLQDDLSSLRQENKMMQEQLSEMNNEVGTVRREKQYREEQLRLAQLEIEQHKSELEALKQQIQQQQQQQQQQMQQNSGNIDLRQNVAVNSQPREANQQPAFSNLQQQQQNNYQQPNNNYLPQVPGNQQLGAVPGNGPQILGIPGRNLQLGAVPGNLPGQPNLHMNNQVPNRALQVPEMPKFDIPVIKTLGGDDHQQDIHIRAEEEADNNPEAPHGDAADKNADKPSDSLPSEDRDDGNSPNNEGENFIREDVRKNYDTDVRDGNADVPQEGGHGDSQPPEDRDGVSKMESQSDAVNNPQDPDHGIDDVPSAGQDDYEDDDNADNNKKVENEEEENQIVPGNMKDYEAENEGLGFELKVEGKEDYGGQDERVGFQIEPGKTGEDNGDDDRLRFNPAG